jgi:hypothetical protein
MYSLEQMPNSYVLGNNILLVLNSNTPGVLQTAMYHKSSNTLNLESRVAHVEIRSTLSGVLRYNQKNPT